MAYRQQSKSLLVCGKTGVGKSFFSNLILQLDPAQKNSQTIFPVYDLIVSGTQKCQSVVNRNVTYGWQHSVVLNILDTPGIFDTSDLAQKQYQNSDKPQSIKNLENMDDTIKQAPYYSQFDKIFLLILASDHFDYHQQAILEQLKIMVGNLNYISVVVTKSSKIYDSTYDSQDDIIVTLYNLQTKMKNHFKKYGITDIYIMANRPITVYQQKNNKESQFYLKQWEQFFLGLKNSCKININVWSKLSETQKNQIGRFFNYRIGMTEQEKQKQQQLYLKRTVEQISQQRTLTANQQNHQDLSFQKLINQQNQKFQEQQRKQKEQQEKALQQQREKQEEMLKEEKRRQKRQRREKQEMLERRQREWEEEQEQLRWEEEQRLREREEELERQREESRRQQQRREEQRRLEEQCQQQEYRTRTRRQTSSSSSGCVSLVTQIKDLNQNVITFDRILNIKQKIQGNNSENFILGVIHYSKIQKCRFLKIQFEHNDYDSIECTSDHLIYSSDRQKYVKANQLNKNDHLFYYNGETYFNVKIVQITEIIKEGFFTPLTSSGSFFGNGILLSCYVSPNGLDIEHDYAHFWMKPLILYRQLTMKYLKQKGMQNFEQRSDQQEYLSLYTRFISGIKRTIK